MTGSFAVSGGFGVATNGLVRIPSLNMTGNRQINSNSGTIGITLNATNYTAAATPVGIATGAFSNSSGTTRGARLYPTDSTTGTGALTAFEIDLLGSGTGTGAKLLIDARTAGTSRFSVTSAGLSTFFSDSIRITTSKTPASPTATGTQGQIAWDASYFYICVSANTWNRAAHATW